MKKRTATLINNDGLPCGVIEAPHEAALRALVPDGFTAVQAAPPSPNHRYVNGTWAPIADSEVLQRAKLEALQKVKRARIDLEQNGFRWKGHVFDSDVLSQLRIFTQAVRGETCVWRTKDNIDVDIPGEQLSDLAVAMSEHMAAAHATYTSVKQKIQQCSTLAELQSIDWPSKEPQL